MSERDEPDGMEKGVRFGCGFLAGAASAATSGFFGVAIFAGYPWATGIAFALICGFLAMKYGDDFWRHWWWR